MLFAKIVHIDPDKKAECIKKRMEGGIPQANVRIIGEWSAIDNSRVILILEAEDAREILKLMYPFQSLTRDELFPVIETEEILKLMAELNKGTSV
ncbi:MAG: DUF3303 domain-containing protein [Thermoleophilia bacterium]|nr:DUF3303 domain-containing protein [Thermoleophilia bacterium]